MKDVKIKAVAFLESMGFTDVHPIMGDSVRLMVRDALKVVRKKMRAKNLKFTLTAESSTPSARVQSFFVIENRKIIGRLNIEAYATHSIVELENCQ